MTDCAACGGTRRCSPRPNPGPLHLVRDRHGALTRPLRSACRPARGTAIDAQAQRFPEIGGAPSGAGRCAWMCRCGSVEAPELPTSPSGSPTPPAHPARPEAALPHVREDDLGIAAAQDDVVAQPVDLVAVGHLVVRPVAFGPDNGARAGRPQGRAEDRVGRRIGGRQPVARSPQGRGRRNRRHRTARAKAGTSRRRDRVSACARSPACSIRHARRGRCPDRKGWRCPRPARAVAYGRSEPVRRTTRQGRAGRARARSPPIPKAPPAKRQPAEMRSDEVGSDNPQPQRGVDPRQPPDRQRPLRHPRHSANRNAAMPAA